MKGISESGAKLTAMRQVVLYPGEDGYWVAEYPSLLGCVRQGRTKEGAIQNIREAREGYILALQQDGLAVPPDHCDAVRVAAGKFIP